MELRGLIPGGRAAAGFRTEAADQQPPQGHSKGQSPFSDRAFPEGSGTWKPALLCHSTGGLWERPGSRLGRLGCLWAASRPQAPSRKNPPAHGVGTASGGHCVFRQSISQVLKMCPGNNRKGCLRKTKCNEDRRADARGIWQRQALYAHVPACVLLVCYTG